MNLEEHLHESERELAHLWKTMAFRGVAGIVFAVIIMIWPSLGLTTLIALFGVLALVFGCATVVGAFNSPVEGKQRAWIVIEGLLGVAVGVVVFAWPSLSALGLLYVIAAWAIVLGAFQVAAAFNLPISGSRSLLLGLSGLLSIAFGVIMFAEPGAGAIALLALIAAFALVTGVMQVAYAIELRRVVGELERPFKPRATAKPVAHG